jgi:glycosyltransferase involved in cell wall biosynthesis
MRILLLAEAANPEWTSVPLVGFHQAAALRQVADVHVVTQVRNRDALVRAGWVEGRDFTAIDSERFAGPLHRLASCLGLGAGRAWSLSTGLASFAYLYFERLVWRTFGARLAAGEFAAVHRITPVSPATPSPLARHCRRLGVPFVLGPLNGGLPWPRGFLAERWREGEVWSALRGLRRLLPFARSTLAHAEVILVGSRSAFADVPPRFRSRTIAMPENGIHAGAHPEPVARARGLPVRFCWAGRIVPCKGLHLGLEALMPLLRERRAELTVFGDGPERGLLAGMAEAGGVAGQVHFAGWLPQAELLAQMRTHDAFLFPSIREFGGGALLEAMACGLYPLVVDYGGPPEICGDAGFRVPIGPRGAIVTALRARATELCAAPQQLEALGRAAWQRAQTFAWSAKAQFYLDLYTRLARGQSG